MPLKLMLLAAGAPFVASGLIFWAARYLGGRSGDAPGRGGLAAGRIADVLGLPMAYLVAQVVILGWPRLPTQDATQKLFWFVIAFSLLGAVEVIVLHRWRLRHAVRVGFVFVVVWSIFAPQREYDWEGAAVYLWPAGLTLVSAASWWSVERCHRLEHASEILFALGLLSAGTGVVLLQSSSALMAQLSGAVGLGVLAVVLSRVGDNFPVQTWLTCGFVSVMTSVFWMRGYLHANMPLSAGVSLIAAYPLLWLIHLKPIRHRSVLVRTVVASLCVLIPLGIALLCCFIESETDSYDYDYGE